MSGWADAAISAGGTLLGSIVGGISAKKNIKRQIDLEREQMAWQSSERVAQNQWSLEQWNRENEYNSPAAQIARLQAAGMSPLAYLGNGSAGESAHLESAAPASSPTLPQIQNPWSGLQSGVNEAIANFLAFKRLHLEEQRVDNETTKTKTDAAKTIAETDTINQMRKGQIDFLGVQIELGKSSKKLNDQKAKESAQSINESKQRVEQILQYMKESGVRVDMMNWQKYCEKQKLPKEIKLLAEQILLANQQANYTHGMREVSKQQAGLVHQQAWSQWKQNEMLGYHWQNYGKDEMDLQNRQMHGGTLSRGSYVFRNAFGTINSMLDSVTKCLQGYMFYQVGQSNASSVRKMQESSENPPGTSTVPPSDYFLP